MFRQIKNNPNKTKLPNHDELLNILNLLIPSTGNIDALFCNAFFEESVELLKHSFFLYEYGYFDCAFYALRQSIENINNMLFIATDPERFNQWKGKEYFPVDNRVKAALSKKNDAYIEIKGVIPEFFQEYDDLLKSVNKYIHKQGFDTFFTYANFCNASNLEERTNLYLSFLKHSIGMMLIMNIALDPLSLALSDPEVDPHIPFDPMTEPIPIRIFEEYLSLDIIERIKTTNHYIALKDYFLSKEGLNEVTYELLRNNIYIVEQLEKIESQVHLLNNFQQLMLKILKSGIKATHFYWENDILGYSTSYLPKRFLTEYRSDQFDNYLLNDASVNQIWHGMHISVYRVFETYLIIQHDDPLTEAEHTVISRLIAEADQYYQKTLFGNEEKKNAL